MSKKAKKPVTDAGKKEEFPLPIYKPKDDIYNQEEKESFEEEPISKAVRTGDQVPGEELDIPGSELDDADEAIGEEDEENNYYSLGGENHEDLEEDKG